MKLQIDRRVTRFKEFRRTAKLRLRKAVRRNFELRFPGELHNNVYFAIYIFTSGESFGAQRNEFSLYFCCNGLGQTQTCPPRLYSRVLSIWVCVRALRIAAVDSRETIQKFRRKICSRGDRDREGHDILGEKERKMILFNLPVILRIEIHGKREKEGERDRALNKDRG